MKLPQNSIHIAALIAILVCAVCVPVVNAKNYYSNVTPAVQYYGLCPSPGYPKVNFDIIYGIHSEYGRGSSTESDGMYDGPPYTVSFRDRSVAPSGQTLSSWYWNFGDGTTSTERNPQHTYATTGSYNGLLGVTPSCGADFNKKVAFTVKISCSNPEPSFSSNVYQGTAPLTVRITDTSLHAPPAISKWAYTFDTAHVSDVKNPMFTFTEPGTYTITQRVSKYCETRDPAAAKWLTAVYSARIQVNPAPDSHAAEDRVTNSTSLTSAQSGTAGSAPPAVPPAAGTGSTSVVTDPAGIGSLSVVTDPAGAKVYVDDLLRGASPTAIPGLAPGTHTLRFEKTGYELMSVPVEIRDGETTVYTTALVPVSGGRSALPLGAATAILALAVGTVCVLAGKRRSR